MSRKYRQRGYQDDDGPRREMERASRRSPGRRSEGPRSRGLGRPTRVTFRCARCGRRAERAVEPATRCGGCGADLHTCTNCRHFDSAAPRECRLEVPVRIARKSERNDCASFEIKETVEARDEEASGEDARAAFDALFDL